MNVHVPGVDLPPTAEFGEHPLHDSKNADYSRLFITSLKTREVRQSVVTLQEVLDGLAPSDRRLHEEIVQLLSDSD